MQHTTIIGFRGKKCTGKNFIADRVKALLNSKLGYTVDSGALADPFKKFLMENLDINEKGCYGTDADKNTLTRYVWDTMFDEIRSKNKFFGPMSNREIMQVFGSDICRRIFGQDIWIKAIKRRIDKSNADFFLITDVRFINEVETIRNVWGGQVWQIIGPQRGEDCIKKDCHSSESQVDINVPIDVIVDNNAGRKLESLDNSLMESLLSYIELRKPTHLQQDNSA